MHISNRAIIIFLSISFLLNTLKAQFTDGNIVAVRVGDGNSSLNSASTAVFLDEYTPGGSFVQSIPLPAAVTGANQPLTLAGSSTSEGGLTRSPDGRYLVLAGYAAAPGIANVSSSSASTISRVIARIDDSGNINSTTLFNSCFSGSNIRCAVTNDGSQFWTAGNSSSSTGAGIVYITLGETGGTKILDTPNNNRYVSIFNGQLYAASGVSGYTKVFAVGTQLPATPGQSQWSYPGFDTANAIPNAFAIDSTGNICYIADSRSITNGGGVQKWIFQDTAWTLSATFTNGISTGLFGLAADWSAPYPKVYAASASHIVQYTDSGSASPAGVNIASANSNTAFRGIAFAPVSSQTSVTENQSQEKYTTLMNYPNPFNPSTTIRFSIYDLMNIGRRHTVSLRIFDILGREITTLIDEEKPAGSYTISWDASGLRSGIYFCRLTAGPVSVTKKMLLIK